MKTSALVAGALALGLAAAAAAGPCIDCDGNKTLDIQWRYDRALPGQTGMDAGQPDVAWPNFLPNRLYVVYAARTPGDPAGYDIYLARSNDGGCSWETRRLTQTPADDIDPAIAVDDMGQCLVVVFTRLSDIFLQTGSIVALASGDGGANFQLEQQLSTTAVTEGISRAPDIAVTPGQVSPHFHAVWQTYREIGPTVRSHVYYKRNLGLCGPVPFPWQGAGSPASANETDLTDADAGVCDLRTAESTNPHVSADTSSKQPFVKSSASVVWESRCALDYHVFFTRTTDSGDFFYGREAVPQVVPPLKIDDAPGTAASETAIDSSDPGNGGMNWNGAVWPDLRTPNQIAMDAQLENGVNVVSDWNKPDVSCAPAPAAATSVPAIATYGSPGGTGAAPFAVVWNDTSPATGADELYFRAGQFVLGAAPNIQFTCAKLPDLLSGVSPLVRGAGMGAATLPSIDDSGGSANLLVAWRDTRSQAGGEVYWKRTDKTAPAPVTGLAAVAEICPKNDIDVTWTAPADCDVAFYHVSTDALDILPVDVVAPTTAAHLVVPDADRKAVTVTVVAEDEACNFSSAVGTTVATPRCPMLKEGTATIAVSCNGNPDNDGQPDPGETVALTLPITNTAGTADATSLVGTLSVTSPPAGVSIVAGGSTYPDIPAGSPIEVNNNTPYRVLLSQTLTCPTTVNLRLDVAGNEDPATLNYSFAVGANGCQTSCIPSCDVGAIKAIALVKARKFPTASDLELSWQADAMAGDGYDVAYVKAKAQIPACKTCPGSTPVASCQPTGTGITICSQPGIVPPAAGMDQLSYEVRGVCAGAEAAQ